MDRPFNSHNKLVLNRHVAENGDVLKTFAFYIGIIYLVHYMDSVFLSPRTEKQNILREKHR